MSLISQFIKPISTKTDIEDLKGWELGTELYDKKQYCRYEVYIIGNLLHVNDKYYECPEEDL